MSTAANIGTRTASAGSEQVVSRALLSLGACAGGREGSGGQSDCLSQFGAFQPLAAYITCMIVSNINRHRGMMTQFLNNPAYGKPSHVMNMQSTHRYCLQSTKKTTPLPVPSVVTLMVSLPPLLLPLPLLLLLAPMPVLRWAAVRIGKGLLRGRPLFLPASTAAV